MTPLQKIRVQNRTVYLTDDEQRLYGALRLVTPTDEEARPPRAVSVSDIWFEDAVGPDWVVAYRLGLQEQDTRVVVSEIRIFPSRGPREPRSGRWAADALGSRASTPAGGIKARTVLRKVRLREFERELSAFLRQVPLAKFRAPAPSTGTRGRTTDLRRLATIAVLYMQRYEAGSSHPTADVAKRLRLTPAAARAAVAKARTLGLLTPTKRGNRGGRATPRAFEILKGRKK